jgi:hypothetical protein
LEADAQATPSIRGSRQRKIRHGILDRRVLQRLYTLLTRATERRGEKTPRPQDVYGSTAPSPMAVQTRRQLSHGCLSGLGFMEHQTGKKSQFRLPSHRYSSFSRRRRTATAALGVQNTMRVTAFSWPGHSNSELHSLRPDYAHLLLFRLLPHRHVTRSMKHC